MKNIIMMLLACTVLTVSYGQDKDKALAEVKSRTVIGGADKMLSTYKAAAIIDMINKPLYSINDKGKKIQAAFFYFTYMERGLFYDEHGAPFISSDTYGTESLNGVLPQDWQTALKNRLKSGDTVRFSNIIVYPNPKEKDFYYSPDLILIVE